MCGLKRTCRQEWLADDGLCELEDLRRNKDSKKQLKTVKILTILTDINSIVGFFLVFCWATKIFNSE